MNQVSKFSLNILLLLSLTAGSLTAVAATTYYRWTDERGNTIHSDRPPPTGVDYEVVRTGAGFKDSESRSENTSPATDGADSTAAQTAAAAQSQKDPELCERAKGNLDALTNSDRVTMRNKKGEVQVLTAQEIKDNIETTHQQISVFCE